MRKIEETTIGSLILTKLNIHVSDYFGPPRLENPPRRNVLVLSAHPIHESLNGALLHATKTGLQEAGHDVRVRRLYFDASCPEENYNGGTFPPLLQPHELQMYNAQFKVNDTLNSNTEKDVSVSTPLCLATEVAEAIEDLQWCNAIVLVYPTWYLFHPFMDGSVLYIC